MSDFNLQAFGIGLANATALALGATGQAGTPAQSAPPTQGQTDGFGLGKISPMLIVAGVGILAVVAFLALRK